MEAKIREIDELNILYRNNVSFEAVFDIFELCPEDTIYILDETNKFLGIIELDDVFENMSNSESWINSKCKKIYQAVNEKELVQDLMQGKNDIKQVSIINEREEFLYVYTLNVNKNLQEQIALLNKWDYIGSNNQKLVVDYLVKLGIEKIVIYGNDELAVRLYQIIKNNFEVSMLSRIEKDCVKNSDLIIVSSFNRIKLWRLNYSQYKKKIIMLNKLISDLLNLKCFSSKLMDKVLRLKNKNVQFHFFEAPIIDKIKNLSYQEEKRSKRLAYYGNDVFEAVVGNSGSINYIANKEQDNGYSVINNNRHNVLCDFRGQHYNVVNGKRVTTNQPVEYDCTIYIFGPCTIRGALVADCCTIASYLQKTINVDPNQKIRVENCGVGGGSDLYNDLKYIANISFNSNDVIIIFEEIEGIRALCEARGIIWHETSSIFDRPHNYGQWFLDRPVHCNYKANWAIAQRMFYEVVENRKAHSFERTDWQEVPEGRSDFESVNNKVFHYNKDLMQYMEYLDSIKADLHGKCRIGSVVVNCNPFTLGHRYLIEKAIEQVDFLYVFVVEEDKSMFSYKDRFKLVQEGTNDLSNIKVISSGIIMASKLTFPEYFNRTAQPTVKINASKDIQVFAQHVAPYLDIHIRFVGDEPFDFITNQYNKQLKELLPLYGIELVEILRKEVSNIPVSASKVRHYLETKEWDKIKELVPDSAYQYLKGKFIL